MTVNDPRGLFKAYVKKQFIGPTNDTFVDSGDEEIITNPPLRKYFSGIIFPNLIKQTTGFDAYPEDEESGDEEEAEENGKSEWNEDPESEDNEVSNEPADKEDFSRIELYPSSFGLSVCLHEFTQSVKVLYSYGRYRQVDPRNDLHPGYQIQLSREDYDQIRHLGLGDGFYLSDLIGYNPDSEAVYLKRMLQGTPGSDPTGDFLIFNEIRRKIYERKKASGAEEQETYTRLETIIRLLAPLYRKGWVREQHTHETDISVDLITREKLYTYEFPRSRDNPVHFRIHVLLIDGWKDLSMIKVMVENCSDIVFKLPLVLSNPALNARCMFQAKLQVECDQLSPFPSLPILDNASIEDRIAECQYRNATIYAKSFNCACDWHTVDDRVTVAATEFMPEVIPPVTSNTSPDGLNETLNIYSNSTYSETGNDDVLKNLYKLADLYEAWIAEQEQTAAEIPLEHGHTAKLIIGHQRDTLARMKNGIEILDGDAANLRLYRLANAAMLVNMAKSRMLDVGFEANCWENMQYHPFQLAFLLINIPCIDDPGSDIREESIDLLWFPTGGGKTEAYLLLSAFTMLVRRLRYGNSGLGTSVIMRYTLRLLTAQQFERAARMVLSLDYVCNRFWPELIQGGPFTIGLWIGSASSPNKLVDGEDSAAEINNRIIEAVDKEAALKANRFPLGVCPWCGRSLVEFGRTGFDCLKTGFRIHCLDPSCPYHEGLPVDIVDESLYMHPPSLLFATVDKFARLAWVPESSAFFGGTDRLPPDLIIQDELHLISGPLGSITALFESVVEMLCRKRGTIPRIIASTATIKNASSQVQALFGNRKVQTFPPPGVNKNDNFFAREDQNNQNREYIGIMPTGKTVTTTQVKLLALLLARRHKLIDLNDQGIDNYWTIVSYYNSLRELGRMYGKSRDEIQQGYLHAILKRNPFSKKYSLNSPRELTSRISGFEIKSILHSLENVNVDRKSPLESRYGAIDLVFATNMISVGLDIDRLNLIVMNGQPKNISEYIQVTSRIARRHPGLVFTLFNPFRVRDRSHYENFVSFHNNFYRHVEPISVTPYTRVAIRKMAPTLLAAYLRLFMGIDDPSEIKKSDLVDFRKFMHERIADFDMCSFLDKIMDMHLEYMVDRLSRDPGMQFKDLLYSASDASVLDHEEGDWLTMNSMREINPNAVIKIVASGKKIRRSDYE